MKIKGHLDLFSGIGGFSLALQNAGVEPSWIGYSDIDNFANELYKRRFTNAKELGDVAKIKLEELPENIDLLTGGFPCQPFSSAGNRLAFEDTRGTLFYEIVRILKFYIQEGRPIPHIVLENVKGLYSAGDRTVFPTIYKILTDIGYSIECELLNSKYFGVPQNRERIYFVGRYSPEGCRPKVFPITENDRRYLQKQLQGEETNTQEQGVQDSESGGRCTLPSGQVNQVNKTNKESGGVQPYQQNRVYDTNGISPALMANKSDLNVDVKGGALRTYPRNSGLTDEEKKTRGKRFEERNDNISNAVTTSSLDSLVKGGAIRGRGDGNKPTLETRKDNLSNAITTTTKTSMVVGKTLNKNQQEKYDKLKVDEHTSGTLTEAFGRGGSSAEYLKMLKKNEKLVGSIRKLTPIECERLQGFPDNWTDGQSDTQRYKQCGNAITVNVAEVIFKKLYGGSDEI